MAFLIERAPTIAPQYIVSSDRVVLGAPLNAGGVAGLHMYHGVVKTLGEPDRPVAVKTPRWTQHCSRCSSRGGISIHEHKNILSMVGLVDVSPFESYGAAEQ